MADALIEKAGRRDALFGIVGLGYVGLPLAVELAGAGYRVLGFDIIERVVTDSTPDARTSRTSATSSSTPSCRPAGSRRPPT